MRSRDHAAAVVPQLEALLLEVAPEDALREHDQLLTSFQETPGKHRLKQVTCLWGCRERKRPAGVAATAAGSAAATRRPRLERWRAP